MGARLETPAWASGSSASRLLVWGDTPWLLPMRRAPRSSRLTHHVAAFLDSCGLDGQLLWLSSGVYEARSDAIHRLAVAVVDPGRGAPAGKWRWVPIEDLATTSGVLPHQRAFVLYLRRLLADTTKGHEFISLRWPEHMHAFLERAGLGEGSAVHDRFVLHRLSPRRLVCEASDTAGSRVFIYAGTAAVYDEALISSWLSDRAGQVVPRVLARDSTHQVWAVEAISGSTAADRPPPGGPRSLARAIGRFQAASRLHSKTLLEAGVPRLNPLALLRALEELLGESGGQAAATSCLHAVDWMDEPCLLHLDPHPGNFMCRDSGEVTLLDLERCAIGPRSLGYALLRFFLRRAAPALYRPTELLAGFLHGERLAGAAVNTPVKTIDHRTVQLIELAFAAQSGLRQVATHELIGTRRLMRDTLSSRLSRCLEAESLGPDRSGLTVDGAVHRD